MTAQELEKLLAQVTPAEWDVGLYGEPTAVSAGKRLVASSGGYSDGKEGTRAENVSNARIIALAPTLARRAIAAEKLARALKNAKAELAEYEIEIRGETYNSPEINAALAEWEAAQ